MLENKRVIITGSNGALGRATSYTARNYGAVVIGFDISNDSSNEKQRKVDLLSFKEIEAEVASLGNIDALVNIAGGFRMGASVHEIDLNEWDEMQAINVTTLRNMLASIVPLMLSRKSGSIVNLGAMSAVRGVSQMSAYIAAKNNVMRITESLSEEVKDFGVNVNAVLPSIIDTPTNRKEMPDANFDDWVTPSSIAEVICFLISDRAKAINGALIPVSDSNR